MRRLLNILVATLFMSPPIMSSPHSFTGGPAVDSLILQAIAEHRAPGAVVAIGSQGKVVFHKAYGNRAVDPTTEPMTEDTIFDCASLTKVIATTTCLMQLFEQGRFRLNDPVVEYLPQFQGGHSNVTIRELMTHFSGLRPDVPLSPSWSGYQAGISLACADPPEAAPGERHIYSDINFELLGELVHRLGGMSLDRFARKNVFLPLRMNDTMFNPPASLKNRIAPTEVDETGVPLRGVVHDPTARRMDGIAGHAGLFSTAHDLARFAQMMLNGGQLDGVRIVSAATIRKFVEPQTPPGQEVLRGLGWDIDSPYSSNRGELYPIGSFGHTGFTGTSIWIDPASQSYVILLTNSVHPHQGQGVVQLRSKVATAAAAGLDIRTQNVTLTGYGELFPRTGFTRQVSRNGATKTGLDVLEASGFAALRGKSVALVTNRSGVDGRGARNVDVMLKAGLKVVRIFSPEHGFAGQEDHPGIADSIDAGTGLPVVSLYGDHLSPTSQMLSDVDVLVFDLQDAGVRFYTYETTLAYCIAAAGKVHVPVMVLDRPNPISGGKVEGPCLNKEHASFVGYLPGCPVRHGMTLGELARMFNGEEHLGATVTVIPMKDWERGDWFDATAIGWVDPSPNLRSLKACTLYPGLCMIEFSPQISVGRGTDAPFEQFGATSIDGSAMAAYLNRRQIPGVRFYPTTFTPTSSNLAGMHVHGVRIELTNRESLEACRLGIEIACALQHLYPELVDWKGASKLIGSDDTIRQIEAGNDPYTILESWIDGLQAFATVRDRYLLYR